MPPQSARRHAGSGDGRFEVAGPSFLSMPLSLSESAGQSRRVTLTGESRSCVVGGSSNCQAAGQFWLGYRGRRADSDRGPLLYELRAIGNSRALEGNVDRNSRISVMRRFPAVPSATRRNAPGPEQRGLRSAQAPPSEEDDVGLLTLERVDRGEASRLRPSTSSLSSTHAQGVPDRLWSPPRPRSSRPMAPVQAWWAQTICPLPDRRL